MLRGVAQFYTVVRVKDGGVWQGRLQSYLGMTLSQRLGQHLDLGEGDILALSAGDTTQAVSLQNRYFLQYFCKTDMTDVIYTVSQKSM